MSRPMNRYNLLPVPQALAIYTTLSTLSIGDRVPDNIYIHDYQNGDIPHWVVREYKQIESLVVLTLIDEACSFQYREGSYHVGMEVFTNSTKTLAGPLYAYAPGCVKASNPLCDIRQNARQMYDRMIAGKRPYAVKSQVDASPVKPTNMQLWGGAS